MLKSLDTEKQPSSWPDCLILLISFASFACGFSSERLGTLEFDIKSATIGIDDFIYL